MKLPSSPCSRSGQTAKPGWQRQVVLIQVMECHRAHMMNAHTLIFTVWISTDEKGFSCDNRTEITKNLCSCTSAGLHDLLRVYVCVAASPRV